MRRINAWGKDNVYAHHSMPASTFKYEVSAYKTHARHGAQILKI